MALTFKAIADFSACYKAARKMPKGVPEGIIVHSTGANNPNLKRYVNAPDVCGVNPNKNYFGGSGSDDVTPHGVVGKDKNGAVKAAQILPYNICCWGCGSGSKGSYNYNPAYIQFEIAEDGLTDKNYFEQAFDLMARVCAELMAQYPSIKIENVISHKEANKRGYASNHGDPENWLGKFGKNMDWFRDKVKSYLTPSTADKTVNFSPRLTAPSTSDKHWIKSTKGGLNDCIEISSGSVLPNCVGYAWGRFYEIIGEKPKLSKNNAEMWYGNTADGYKRLQTPALGAVICWSKGVVGNEADGAGHVAIVEQILPNGDIVTSNSAYGGSRFYTTTVKKSDGYNFGAYKFQGFILPPTTARTPAALKVGDTVNFTGTVHYVESTATSGKACKPGKAKVTKIVKGTPHPIHLVNDGTGSTVRGWVDEKDIRR